MGDAHAALEQLWDTFAGDTEQGLRTLLRLAEQRYVAGAVGDPFALAPLVAATFCSDRDLGQHQRFTYRSVGESIGKLVLAWLRGMARDEEEAHPLRQQVRDRILAADSQHDDEFAIEALATLGRDLDDRAEQWLRDQAVHAPARLKVAVESFGAVTSLGPCSPRLLLDLAEAYYIDRSGPDGMSDWGLHEGIRDHQAKGFGPPYTAWYFGPFFRLLREVPREALAMINRMLDHAAAVRLRSLHHTSRSLTEESGPSWLGIGIDFPGSGTRHYTGDGHVWGWYRGSTSGPYPCMSALLAVERFAEQLLTSLRWPLAQVVDLLLRDCNNLAMPGLVVGLLIRRCEAAADLLDPWLASPQVWRLEFSRTTAEHFHVRGGETDEAIGADRRRWRLRETGQYMTARALLEGDRARLEALEQVADRLLERARTDLEDASQEELAAVQGWASALRKENFRTHRLPDGRLAADYTPPASLTEILAPSASRSHVVNEALRLQTRYTDPERAPDTWDAESLAADLARARQLTADPDLPADGPHNSQGAQAAVAAAAVTSHARGRLAASHEDLQWAAATLLTAATDPNPGGLGWMGADYSAATALPSLLLAPFNDLDLAPSRLQAGLDALATSVRDEVRTAFVTECTAVWSAPCTNAQAHTPCRRHAPLWSAMEASLRDCRRRADDPHHGSGRAQLLPPYTETLPAVAAHDLLPDRLALPIACTAHARTTPCLAPQADTLLPVLFEVHRTATDCWVTDRYAGGYGPQRELVARVLIELAAQGMPEPLVAHLVTFAANANALQQLLSDCATLFTYDPALRAHLPTVWPLILTTTLDAVDAGADLHADGHWADYALAALLPTPQLRMDDTNPDATLNRVRGDWLAPAALGDLAERWITLARGEPKASDALAQFAATAPEPWQRTTGLDWLERLIDGHYAALAGHCLFVIDWLASLRSTTTLDAAALGRWRRISDGLAAAGDSRAAGLQQLDE